MGPCQTPKFKVWPEEDELKKEEVGGTRQGKGTSTEILGE